MTIKDKKIIGRLFHQERFGLTSIGLIYNVKRQRVHQIVRGFSYVNFNFIIGRCKVCNDKDIEETHFIDNDQTNTKPKNILAVCGDCHKDINQRNKKKLKR